MGGEQGLLDGCGQICRRGEMHDARRAADGVGGLDHRLIDAPAEPLVDEAGRLAQFLLEQGPHGVLRNSR